MVRFEELQELWQNQSGRAPIPFDPRGLTEELQRFGKRQNWINGVKAALIIFLFVRILLYSSREPLALCGTLLMFGGLVTYLVLDWRNQIGIARLDFSSPSVEFVRKAYERLQHQLNPMRRLLWPLVVSIGGGFNLVLLAPHGASTRQRVYEHVTATALPFAAYVLGAKVRELRFRRECGAVLERLSTLLGTLEKHVS